jgi:hypothetical protein
MAVPVPLRSEAAAVASALSTDAGTRIFSPAAVFEFIQEVQVEFAEDVREPGTDHWRRFVALYETLERARIVEGQGPAGLGFYSSLSALGSVELKGTGIALLRLPLAALRPDHPVAQALEPLIAPPAAAAAMLLLRRPPDDEEMEALRTAGSSDALLAFVESATADQLFGTGRRLFVKASKGFVDPLQAHVERRRL